MCQALDLKWKSKMHMKAVISLRHTVKLIPAERDLSAQRQRFFPVSDLIEICQIILPHKPQCSGWLSGTYMLHAVDVSRSRRGGFFFSLSCAAAVPFSPSRFQILQMWSPWARTALMRRMKRGRKRSQRQKWRVWTRLWGRWLALLTTVKRISSSRTLRRWPRAAAWVGETKHSHATLKEYFLGKKHCLVSFRGAGRFFQTDVRLVSIFHLSLGKKMNWLISQNVELFL